MAAAVLGQLAPAKALFRRATLPIFPTEPRARLCTTTYPFRHLFLNDRQMNLVRFADLARSAFGIKNIEPLDSHLGASDPASLGRLRQRLEEMGTTVIDVCASVKNSFYDPDPEKRASAARQSQLWVDAAAAVGALSVRIHVRGVEGSQPDIERCASTLGGVAGYAVSRGVVVNLENDDAESEDPFFLVKVIQRVNSPSLRALPDFGNSMERGEVFNYAALRGLFPYAWDVAHVKDVLTENGKTWRIDLAKVIGIARAAGFRGYYAMEWEGEGDPMEGTKRLAQRTLQAMRQQSAHSSGGGL